MIACDRSCILKPHTMYRVPWGVPSVIWVEIACRDRYPQRVGALVLVLSLLLPSEPGIFLRGAPAEKLGSGYIAYHGCNHVCPGRGRYDTALEAQLPNLQAT